MGVVIVESLEFNEIYQLAQEFNLEGIINFKPLKGGQVNTNYKIQKEQKNYVLTQFHKKEYKDVCDLITLLNCLIQNDFPTPKPLQTPDGKPYTKLNDHYVILRECCEGEPIEIKKMEEKHMYFIGEILAKLHSIKAPGFLPKQHMYGIQEYNKLINSDIEKDNYRGWLKKKQSRLWSVYDLNLPKRLIHGDFFWDNIIWSKDEKGNDKIEGVIDFEEACNYYRIFDIGMAIVGNCIKSKKINLEKARALINGYERSLDKKEKLNQEEKENLKLFIEYATIATSYQRFLLKKQGISEDKLRPFEDMMRIADNINRISDRIFIESIFKLSKPFHLPLS